MPHKAKSKPAGNILNNQHAPPHSPNIMQCGASSSLATFKPSAATQQFLVLMNQNLQVLSQFTWADLMAICPNAGKCVQVYEDLLTMNFTLVGDHASHGNHNQESDTIISDIKEKEEEIDVNTVAYCLSIHGQWCEKNRYIIESDEECNTLINNLRLFAELFGAIPAPHKCPPPPPCPHALGLTRMMLYSIGALCQPPCVHVCTKMIPHHARIFTLKMPPPLPCLLPHQSNDDTSMELTAPTCAFSEAASQTPAPIHVVDMPPPPPSIPAAAAPIPKPGPKPRPSYASAAAKNLNPAAPPFVRGPPHAPVAPPAQAPRTSLNPHLKRPFYAT
ncbi:hypothetical protein P691DRAFT_768206 [Macrolepiota fuliginosa MF-IS2]|uniref:Uncharacterized protein n=1 Tax=Macrolepiota fuliginosa MF-IS2 TaxID=1400762 RepID=A0A9P5WZG8_9AGAR|nr:hypothetical protein P691DRAFT_768206 [Macrolepiota fuliginosa MF-IS2]